MAVEIRVKPTRELFFNEENYFGIFGCDVNPDDMDKVKLNQYGNISIKGVCPRLEMGTEYTVIVKEDSGSSYKGSYLIDSIKQDRPTTISEQKTFLETVLTENQVANIYDVYGEDQDVVGMIEKGEFDYTKVKGLGDKTFEKLRKKVLENIDLSEVLTFLSKYGIKYNMIAKLVKEYGNPQIVIDKIEKNPYVLTEVKGIGFVKADEIAKSVGFEMTSPERIGSCLVYCIMEENQSGHSWLDYKLLLNKAVDLLNINKKYVEEVLESEPKGIIKVDERYTLKTIYDAEKYVAHSIEYYRTINETIFKRDELDGMIDDYCKKNNLELEENQRQFFHDWNENNILLLIGNAGMGKSFLVGILLELIKNKNLTTALLTPTGKSAKVLSGYTGRIAQTIHRKVGIFEEDNDGSKLITEDIIIVDEASMCDIFIVKKLFNAIDNNRARVLFIGDDAQLLSVSVGRFLYDVIESNKVKVSRLKKVFRQADGGILDVATDTREGISFISDGADGRVVFGRDCVFWLTKQDYIRDGVIVNYKKVIQRYSPEDVVILSPTNKGSLGTVALNKEIQKIANPASSNKKEKAVGKKSDPTIFRVGDAVMNIINTYGIETVNGGLADIYNGDTGKIIDIDEKEKVFIVEIDGIQVKMKFGTILTNLVHAWSMSIHKSQGSGYKVVIIVLDKSMTFQLNKNLLYTAFTRSKEYMLVLGQPQVINRALKKSANTERRSFLGELLAGEPTNEGIA